MNRIIVIIVYNPPEVKQLIIVKVLTTWKNWIYIEHVKNVQNSPVVETPETSGQASYLSGRQSNQEMMMNDDVAGMKQLKNYKRQ